MEAGVPQIKVSAHGVGKRKNNVWQEAWRRVVDKKSFQNQKPSQATVKSSGLFWAEGVARLGFMLRLGNGS